ncbi:MAG: histidinol-phosphate transaminase [Bacteroidales bacterium]
MIRIEKLARPSVLALKPYSSARDEYSGSAGVFLDANECPFNAPFNRYPDPHQRLLKDRIAAITGTSSNNIFLGNGSDEAIDLLIRAFCEPGCDEVIAMDPSYGMYEVAAAVNNVSLKKVRLNEDFSLNADAMLRVVGDHTKLIFLCSPNNPTSNSLSAASIGKILKGFTGLVILDEAYIDFSGAHTFLDKLKEHENLVVLRTFSKAWGLAGIRLGMAFADPAVISILDKIKYPYNVNILTQEKAMEALSDPEKKNEWVKTILAEREKLIPQIKLLPWVSMIYPSDANFILVQVLNPKAVYNWLVKNSIIVRDRSTVTLCEGCLRITVGTPEENKALIQSLLDFKE